MLQFEPRALYSALAPVLLAVSTSLLGAAPATRLYAAERLSLWSGRAPVGQGQFDAADAYITFYPASEPNGAAMVICPGGGYGGLVLGPEGHGIAEWLNRHGIAGVVLEYRLPKGRPFVPLLDAQRAIRTVRFKAKQWEIDPGRIGIIGFSAGGHLAATAGTHFDDGNTKAADPINRLSCRPDFAVLIYPVISMGVQTHGGSRANLLGQDPKPEMIALFSNEKQVNEKTPPMFLAHAKDDKVVSPDNSRMMYDALKAHKVSAEYLELPSGGHGLNGYKGPMWDAWQAKSLAWLAVQKIIPAATGSACMRPVFVTSDSNGGWSNGGYYLHNNMWNRGKYSCLESLYACSYHNWYVVANMNDNSRDGAVKTYPNVHKDYENVPIRSFKSITSTFATTSPHVGIYNVAYDIWTNGIATSSSTEFMIWTENFHQSPAGSRVTTATFGGRNYNVWKTANSRYIAFVPTTAFTSGTVDLLAILQWATAQGWLAPNSTLGQIGFGVEIVSTNGANARFDFTDFSITAK